MRLPSKVQISDLKPTESSQICLYRSYLSFLCLCALSICSGFLMIQRLPNLISSVEQELALEEAKNIVGGSGDHHNFAHFISLHTDEVAADSITSDDPSRTPTFPKINSN
ncbi:hypothetical protein [Brasilonema sp. UFV-L1]|uniref:hypothetical protein n=1 Tax=Brasilonema sp. UFV-L1 TaxID=2234130 RepID=UPI00145CCF56|nr:hypothetical protein [Brasilonema sp. UFV-L1]NMG07450.1 hypothetical protein [Brasilonema sp. UFV-L1]